MPPMRATPSPGPGGFEAGPRIARTWCAVARSRKTRSMMFGNAESETGRLEAFSDDVLAVIITIITFKLQTPVGGSFTDLRSQLPALLIYILSFVIIGIYWNNHHHLLRAARRVT